MELTLQEKLRLIEFFEFQLDKEVSKPIEKINTEAVDLYVEVLLDLQDKHIELSPEFIDEQVRKIFHPEEKAAAPEAVKTTKKYFNKKKVWLVAACIAILVALFSIISVANDWNVFDFLSEKFGSVHSAPVGEEQNLNGVTVINHGNGTTYKTIEDALKTEKLDVLYPSVLFGETRITDITFFTENSTDVMLFGFNNPNISIYVHFDTTLDNNIKKDATEVKEINSITCYIYEFSDVNSYQINFEYNGDTYILNHSNKNLLIEIIENLEEIKNEN